MEKHNLHDDVVNLDNGITITGLSYQEMGMLSDMSNYVHFDVLFDNETGTFEVKVI